MPRQSITLTEPNDKWLKSLIANQEYSSKSEILNDLVRRARHQQDKINFIRLKLERAEKGGFTTDGKDEIIKASKQSLND